MLAHLKRICESVASRIREERGRDLSVHASERKRSTRLIDRIAEEVILTYVERHGLDLDILSEESGLIDRGGRETLIADPIDGTHNAIRGISYFATSLAVGTGDITDVRCGMVMNLSTADTFWAEKGGGAYLNGRRIHTRMLAERGSFFLGYLGRHAAGGTDRILRLATRSRALGCASLEMCLVASGGADAFLTLAGDGETGLRVWDIAAGYIILREAGGDAVVPGRSGVRPLEMPLDPEERTSLIAYGDRVVLDTIKPYLGWSGAPPPDAGASGQAVSRDAGHHNV